MNPNPEMRTPPAPSPAPAPAPQPKGKSRRLWKWLALPVIGAALLGAYSCATLKMVQDEIRTTPRDPKTGIVLGSEALILDPPGAANTPTSACLLIHGFITSRRDFGDMGRRLAEAGFHVEMMRLPGHGTTPRDFAKTTPEEMILAVEEAYQRLRSQYRQVNIIGFSMGGTLTTLLASHGGVDKVVLASPYFGVTYKWYYVLPAEWWESLLGWAVPYVIKSDGWIQINDPEMKKNFLTYRCVPTNGVNTLMALGRRANRPEVLGAIRCPVLLIMAEGDYAANTGCAKKAAAQMISAKVEQCWLNPRNHHHIFMNDDRAQTEQTIIDFLKKK